MRFEVFAEKIGLVGKLRGVFFLEQQAGEHENADVGYFLRVVEYSVFEVFPFDEFFVFFIIARAFFREEVEILVFQRGVFSSAEPFFYNSACTVKTEIQQSGKYMAIVQNYGICDFAGSVQFRVLDFIMGVFVAEQVD